MPPSPTSSGPHAQSTIRVSVFFRIKSEDFFFTIYKLLYDTFEILIFNYCRHLQIFKRKFNI